MRLGSIRVRLTACIAVLLVLLVVVSTSAIVSLLRIGWQVEAIDQKWLSGTQLLGDLKNGVSEFRVAESYRSLAVDQPGMIQAEFLAEREARRIDDLLLRFGRIAPDVDMVDDVHQFERSWQDLLVAHRAWIDEAAGEQMTRPMGYGSPLQKGYEAVQLAANNLIDDATRAANHEAMAANLAAFRVTMLLIALSVVAGLLAIGLMIHAELHIARPLAAITSGLTRLANGDRNSRVPELHRRDEIGAMATAFEVFRRNAVALGEAQERAEALAHHDALTGLANRRLFSDRLTASLGSAAKNLVGTLMLIDLDRFKPINDLHGHAIGDLVLCEIAGRLRSLTTAGAFVARLGGDEFAIILPLARDRLAAIDEVVPLAARIVERFNEKIGLAVGDVSVGASIGIAMMPSDGATPEDILRNADLALYRAKRDGRGTFRFFEAGMDAEMRAKADLEADLRMALAEHRFLPFYQPVIELASNRVVGVEVLARWTHERRGAVPPDVFIPLLDQLGGLGRMTEALLRRAVADAKTWNADIGLAVNVSPRQLQDLAFPAMIANILLAAGFPPQRLEIEVTETVLLDDTSLARTSIEALRALGVRVVLDDFGTGYSSLSHLRDLKFDKIKIDRSFVSTMLHSTDSAAIVDAVLGLARSLGMSVVAEGVETAEVAQSLLSRGCLLAQGFLYSPAIPAEALPILVDAAPPRLKAG